MNRRLRLTFVAALTLLACFRLAATVSAQSKLNGCAICHATLPQSDLAAPVKAVSGDVHEKNGIRCVDCHGGNAATGEKARAHDPEKGYRREPSGATICARCHAAFAERFATSSHAPLFSCVECHGNHGVKLPSDSLLGTSRDATCANCHSGADDPGFVAASTMRTSIDRLRQAIDASGNLLARVRNAGMEVGDQGLELNEARSKLILARMEIHASSPARLDPIVADGMKLTTGIDRAGQQAIAELAFRRRGLFVSLGLILLFVVALTLKIRALDRRRRS